MKYLLLLIGLFGINFLYSQNDHSFRLITDNNFNYTRIDTASCGNEISKIRYINEIDSNEFYIEIFNNGNLETGYLKKNLPYGLWRRYDSNGLILDELNFDTLKIKYTDLVDIMNNRKINPVFYNIYFDHDSGFCDEMKNSWVISIFLREEKEYQLREEISVNTITGEMKSDTLSIFSQLLSSCQCDEEPHFKGGEDKLKKFILKSTHFPINENGHNSVGVSFLITQSGKIEDIEIGCANTGYYNREALRIVQKMPTWIPAKKNSKSIECKHHISINFE
jgi:hypothetical protein